MLKIYTNECSHTPRCKILTPFNFAQQRYLKEKHREHYKMYTFCALEDLEEHKCIKCCFPFHYKVLLHEHNKLQETDVHGCFRNGGLYVTMDEIAKYKCEHCYQNFDSDLVFSKHLVYCRGHFNTYSNYEQVAFQKVVFQEEKVVEEAYTCEICEYVCVSEEKLYLHVQYNHSIEIYACGRCEFKVKTAGAVERHITVKHQPPEGLPRISYEHSLEKCGAQFLSLHTAVIHSKVRELPPKAVRPKIVNDKPLLSCGNCSFKSKSKNYLRRHIWLRHNPDAQLKCKHCSYTTKYKQILKNHIICKHTAVQEIKWETCEHCSSKLKTRKLLKAHNAIKHNIKSLTCKNCSSFSTDTIFKLKRHILDKHSQTLEIAKLFNCKHCSFKARTNLELSYHIQQTHTKVDGVKCLQCEHCSFRGSHGALTRHLRIKHFSGMQTPKVSKCRQCSFKCNQKRRLDVHMIRKHTAPEDIEWFDCEQCSYRAIIREHLKQHIVRMHTAEDLVPWRRCEKCSFKTKLTQTLRCHVAAKHADPIVTKQILGLG